MNRLSLILSALAATLCLRAFAAPVELPIWPNGVGPGSEGMKLQQNIFERSPNPKAPNRAVVGVTRPTLTVFAPAKPNGTAIIITPGGAYVHEGIDNEGSDIAPPFNAAGITVFVLQYRLPGEGHNGSNGKDGKARDIPLADAQRAIRYVRAHAAEWGINPSKIGVMGFSAGGHLAASLATKYASTVFAPQDAVDQLSARPDFLVLIYPLITMAEPGRHKDSREALLGLNPTEQEVFDYSLENKVHKDMPPTFIALAANDGIVAPQTNSLLYQQRLVAQRVPVEMHVFADGWHGFGTRGAIGWRIAIWPQMTLDWMSSIGMRP